MELMDFCILFDDIPFDFYKKVPQVKEGLLMLNWLIKLLEI